MGKPDVRHRLRDVPLLRQRRVHIDKPGPAVATQGGCVCGMDAHEDVRTTDQRKGGQVAHQVPADTSTADARGNDQASQLGLALIQPKFAIADRPPGVL